MPDLHDRITGASATAGAPKPNAAANNNKQKQSNGKCFSNFLLVYNFDFPLGNKNQQGGVVRKNSF